MTMRFIPQDGSSDLAPHAHRFTLRGEPGALRFPGLCPNCGQTAAGTIGYAKVFRRTDSESPTEHVVVAVEVPFCAACIARHRADSTPRSLLADLGSSFSTAEMLGAVFPAMGAAFLLWIGLKELFRGRFTSALVMLGLAAFFGVIAWFQRAAVWAGTAHLRVPPQTEVTRAFDFGDPAAPIFESARFTCTVRDAGFAAELLRLNPDREWRPDSPEVKAEQRRASRTTWILMAVIAAVVLVGFFVGWWR